ncbi:PQQ-binding-like beta-propeller repeat protein [Natronosporangium hydrolyticum]|uniref:PQQ-binding-like beta-propeller repeat protein n=1 Tax=Natronosporangium hydrolyticum TaxID=2811111 RepID=A0A895YJ54_9ACTN|nr:PQQ-binding-like beta-propeller repeat protein [Natronosporangium hydrolyticum]QSB15393.1 PQQ-binding-like beta-propeller repeat protein [Natronosporangium hydrolyticum]
MHSDVASVTDDRPLRWPLVVAAAAVSLELVGLAGVVLGGWLGWEWDEPLWRLGGGTRAFTLGALVVTGLLLAAGWRARDGVAKSQFHLLAAVAATAALIGAGLIQSDIAPPARGLGGSVFTVAAALLIAGGALGFVGYAVWDRAPLAAHEERLPAARQRRLSRVGRGAGAVAAVAALTGSMLLAPHFYSTVDSRTAPDRAVEGGPPSLQSDPQWHAELPGRLVFLGFSGAATAGGLLVPEASGVRMLEPATGQVRWHWRDSSYSLRQSATSDEGRIVVLALSFRSEFGEPPTERDRVVALDATTGQLRWDRYDNRLVEQFDNVAAVANQPLLLTPLDPEPLSPSAGLFPSSVLDPVGIQAIGSDDGQPRWRFEETPGCGLSNAYVGDTGVVVMFEVCERRARGEEASCALTALDVTDGRRLWTWPTAERIDPEREYAHRCDVTVAGGHVFLSYSIGRGDRFPEPGPMLALDAGDGRERWTVPVDAPDRRGLDSPVVAGGQLVGRSGAVDSDEPVLVIRSLVDGQIRTEVPLPHDRTIGLRQAGDDRVWVVGHHEESYQIVVSEVDTVTGELLAVTEVPEVAEEYRYAGATLVVGPGTLVIALQRQPAGERTTETDLVLYGLG